MNSTNQQHHHHHHAHPGTRLRGLAAMLVLVAFVAGVPIVLLAIGAIPDLSEFSWSRLTAPDDGTLALQILACICWGAWATFTYQLLASIVSQVRGIRAPRLPGLAVPQLAADRLVAAAALLFVAVPATTALVPSPHADATPTATHAGPETTVGTATENATVLPIAAQSPTSAAAPHPSRAAHGSAPTHGSEPQVEPYTVKRGDSLWRIAEDRLEDGARYVDLVDLNQDVLDGRPDFLTPGTVLRVPVRPSTANPLPAGSPRAYVVQPGDTLSQIAAAELGDPAAYPAIFEASRDTLQPDGRRLIDPDLIYAGWKLTIPLHQVSDEDSDAQSDDPPATRHIKPHADTDAVRARTQGPAATATPEAAPPSADARSETSDHVSEQQNPADDEPDTAAPAWLLPGLAGAGAVLGGALWLVLRAQRHTQLRHRRPGTIVPPPPCELVAAEKTARATATIVAPSIDTLDAALRALPQHLRLLTATLDEHTIALSLRAPADLPDPWRGAGTGWQIRLSDVPKPPADTFPPYPLLVSIGQEDDGAFLFLNLEELRTVTLAGDAERMRALARHVAAELAVNPWSSVTTVNVLGLGADLASFNLGRVRTHPAGDTAFINELARSLSAITEPSDPDDFSAAIIASTDQAAADLDRLAEVLESAPGRSSAALLELNGDRRPAGAHLEVTADGRLRAMSLGVDVTSAGLSEDEARACALLLDLTLDQTMTSIPSPTPIPPPTSSQLSGAANDGDPVSDLGGALVDDLTEPRTDAATGDSSLLPLAAHVYADAAATTVDDIDVLAPRAAPQARAIVEAADPDLDEDLARWESPTTASAKLTLLGPVSARTTGDAKTTAHRRPFYVELLAYLSLHPRGATAAEVADAFGLKPNRVRVDMSQLRRWLGNDPRTGYPYLPKAVPSAGSDSAAVYQVHGVLSDLDLFRRLRARGQSRGAEGVDDLIAALRLVSGEPFSHLREDHWNWLLDGERWDHVMSAAIVDVGHIVTTQAHATGDPDLALWAAQVAYAASPFDEVAQLDIIAAEKAHGDHEQADRDLRENVFNRRDDDQPPIDVPGRSRQVIDAKNWSAPGPRTRRTG